MHRATRGPKQRSAQKQARKNTGRIYSSRFLKTALIFTITLLILPVTKQSGTIRSLRSDSSLAFDPSETAIENRVVFGAMLLSVAIVLYLSPGMQALLRRWGKARRDESERRFWAQREETDRRQAEAQARMEAERHRSHEEEQGQEE